MEADIPKKREPPGQATMFKPLVFNFAPPPDEERINHVVGIAVRMFMAAYARR
jgi:hypothetical protein